MKFTTPDHDEADITVIPLIDVILVLLIFFMATATFDQTARLKVDLPEASSQERIDNSGGLVIQIDAEGRYFVNASEVLNTRIDTLKQAIEAQAGSDREQAVVIRADARSPHQSVVTAMDALGQLGFAHLSIATIRSDTEG